MSRASGWTCRAAVWALVVVAVLGASAQSRSAEVGLVVYQGKRVLFLEDISAGEGRKREGMRTADVAKLEALLVRERVDEILLNSGGGSESAGLAIGRLLRKHGLATRIPPGARCASACADAFLGGVIRRVDQGGRYGVHMPTGVNDTEYLEKVLTILVELRRKKEAGIDDARSVLQFFEQSGARMASRWAAFVIEMGASHRLVALGIAAPADEMTWLTRRQLLDFNVVNVAD